MSLPLYKLTIDENLESDLEVNYVALVDAPAIEKNFLAFRDRLGFAIQSEERRIISGPAMLADTPIYRRDDNGEYNVVFDKETIFTIVQKFFKKDFLQNFNLFHDPSQVTDGVTVFESFITDSSRGILPMKGFEDAPDGSWFISAKVDNDVIWNKIKSGEVKGFSVEGLFKQLPMKQTYTLEQAWKAIENILNGTALN